MADPGDADSIAAVIYDAFLEFKPLYTDEAFAATTPASEQIKDRLEEGPVWVAVYNDEIAGTVSAVAREDSVYIRSMAVAPAARGLGIGKSLLNEVERYASSKGHYLLVLSTTPFLTQAIQLYENAGFVRTVEGPQDLFGTPIFTMEKTIR